MHNAVVNLQHPSFLLQRIENHMLFVCFVKAWAETARRLPPRKLQEFQVKIMELAFQYRG